VIVTRTAKDIIKGGRLAERSVPVCMRADLVAWHEELDRRLQKAVSEPRDSLAAGSAVSGLSEQILALEAEMADSTIDFHLRAMSRPKWRAFCAEHPPRKTADGSVDERDLYISVNRDTFFDALIRRSVVAPELDDDDWAELLGDDEHDGKLSDVEYDRVADAAWGLNRRGVDVPFSAAASRLTPASEPE